MFCIIKGVDILVYKNSLNHNVKGKYSVVIFKIDFLIESVTLDLKCMVVDMFKYHRI